MKRSNVRAARTLALPAEAPLIVNGWTLFFHPLFLGKVDVLTTEVERRKVIDPVGYESKNAAQRLTAIFRLAFEVIPQDPTRPEYRQGATLGRDRKHWFRAKFFQQYRLFFRYHLASRIVIFTWVNDDDTKRAYESADDAYRVFRRMLDSGDPPEDWGTLLTEAKAALPRAKRVMRRLS